jgi:transcription initiation factor TFIID subunit TAF12
LRLIEGTARIHSRWFLKIPGFSDIFQAPAPDCWDVMYRCYEPSTEYDQNIEQIKTEVLEGTAQPSDPPLSELA